MRIILCSLLGCFATAASAITYPIPVNGWYECNKDTFVNPLSKQSKTASTEVEQLRVTFGRSDSILSNLAKPLGYNEMESSNSTSDARTNSMTIQCAQLTLPLCHTGVCDANSNIQVFVKRILASKQNTSPKAIWMLQGGPGASSVAMEKIMFSTYLALEGTTDVYTMDHRGTGRSHRLECTAAQVETSGSPTNGELTPEVLSACIQDVNTQLGGSPNSSVLSAFSTTSAAMDISALITNTNNSNSYVYGVSYGTYLVERLMQLNNTNIKGYILDGVVSQSGSQDNKKLFFNDWDTNMGSIAESVLSLCYLDSYCMEKFMNVDIKVALKTVYERFDTKDSVECQMDVRKYAGRNNDPVQTLRGLFAKLLQDQDMRGFIPILVYRFLRCDNAKFHDSLIISNFLTQFAKMYVSTFLSFKVLKCVRSSNLPDESDNYKSDLLYLLIVTSELWRFPTESFQTLSEASSKAIISSNVASMLPMVCIASGAKDPNCASLLKPSNDFLLQYPRDQYYDKAITIPSQSSVLMLSGLLDPQTPPKYANYQFESFVGTAKRLFEFKYSSHGTVLTSLKSADGTTCAISLIASYIGANGNVNAIDTTCMNQISAATAGVFHIDEKIADVMLAPKYSFDPYESPALGYFKESNGLASYQSLHSSNSSTVKQYFTPMVIGFVLAGIFLIAIIALVYYIRTKTIPKTSKEATLLTPVNNDAI
ncbi:serine protease family S33 [Thraustotheca clavata]|uniref:Serine protease family S33 n=1 Tax=Thraustotheca clavata TaxID=74557 RepID=A0A1V9Y7U3_9STRA|nr:serine protease family S33 [Thraustotheca clavata]